MFEIIAVEDSGFVRLAGEAPVGRGVDEYGAARFREFLDEFITFCMEMVFGKDLHSKQPYEMMKGENRYEKRSHIR